MTDPNDPSLFFPILRYFAFDHLPASLQDVARPFARLAEFVAVRAITSQKEDYEAAHAETGAALRKLLEAKDCAVRADL